MDKEHIEKQKAVCKQKDEYLTKKEVKGFLKHMHSRKGAVKLLPYRCEWCGLWHTKSKNKAKERKRKIGR